MNYVKLFIVIFSINSFNINGQNSYFFTSHKAHTFPFEGSRGDSYKEKSDATVEKDFIIPAFEVISINFGVWAYNKYLTKEGWSDIGFNTMKSNIETGFQWDNDGFLMNQFAHPYHGSQYFSAARSNGLSFWESQPYAFGGSLMWELFMENEAPSYNDIINTPVSGALIGEITFRTADLVIDESRTGFARVLSEALAMIINPVKGLNRLARGKIWSIGEKKEKPDFSFSASIGTNSIFFDNKRENRKTYALTRLNLTYGNLMDVSEHEKPFDYFSVSSELDFTLTDNISTSSASGTLWDKKIKIWENSQTIIGVYKELDLLINTIYKFTATQATIILIRNRELPEDSGLTGSISASFIFLGGINSQYSSVEGKDYNLGPGAAAAVSLNYWLSNSLSIESSYKKYWIHTVSGAKGEEFAGHLNISINLHLSGHSFFGAELTLFHRHAYYTKYPETSEYDSAVKTYYTFAF